MQQNSLDAEAGFDALQLRVQQPGQIGGIVRGQRGGDGDLLDGVIDAEELRKNAVRALVLAGEMGAEPGREEVDGVGEVLRRADRFQEIQPLGKRRRRARPGDGFLRHAERLVQPQQRQRAEAGGYLAARKPAQVADLAQAQAAQPGGDPWPKPQQADRQFFQRVPLLAGSKDRAGARNGAGGGPRDGSMRQRPGGPRRVGNGEAREQEMAEQAGPQVFGQSQFAIEQMRAAGDVEPDAVFPGFAAGGQIGGGKRRIAFAPSGEVGQGGGIRVRVGLVRDQSGAEAACIGQRLADAQPLRRRVRPDGGQAAHAMDCLDRDGGLIRRAILPQAKDRPAPQAKN